MTNWADRCRHALGVAASRHECSVDLEPALASIDLCSRDSFLTAFGQVRFPQSHPRARRLAGAYYTPAALMDPILEQALLPVLVRRWALRWGGDRLPPLPDWTDADRASAVDELLRLRVLDPSCGPGLFLLAAGERLADQLCLLRHAGEPASPHQRQLARKEVAEHCLRGIDTDPSAIAAASILIDHWADPLQPLGGAARLLVADGLEFPLDWLPGSSVDVIVGNPPFQNAVEREGDEAIRWAKLRRSDPVFADLGGTADLAYYFVARAHEITAADGAIGLVLPRAFLSTPSCEALRERLLAERPPAMILAPSDPYLFPGANIFVCAMVLTRGETCLAGTDRLEPVAIRTSNWGRDIAGPEGLSRTGKTLADEFDLSASLTTGMAYDLLPFIEESPLDEGEVFPRDRPLRLVTTGLIEPGRCEWGCRPCRYLKRIFQRPIVRPQRNALPATLRVRLERMSRPKVMVAGLSLRIEAIVDAEAEYLGAVSTYAIFDRKDNVDRLTRLCDYLNSDRVSDRLRAELGATALGGGRITVTKSFLARLPIDSSL